MIQAHERRGLTAVHTQATLVLQKLPAGWRGAAARVHGSVRNALKGALQGRTGDGKAPSRVSVAPPSPAAVLLGELVEFRVQCYRPLRGGNPK